MRKRVILSGLMVIFLMTCGTGASASLTLNEAALRFSDVPQSSPFYDAIYWAVDYGITNGTAPATFSPSEPCKRKHIIMFLWRGCGKPYDENWLYPFENDSDLTKDSDFAKAATWAFWHNPRLEDGEFRFNDPDMLSFLPENLCTRGEAVIYLWKLAGRPESDAQESSVFLDVEWNDRSDDAYFRELPFAVAWAVENNITKGTSTESFSPGQICTRGQIVTFLYRFSRTSYGKDAFVSA